MRVELWICGLIAFSSTLAAGAEPQPRLTGQAAVDAILNEPLPDASYGNAAPTECIDMLYSSSVRTEVLDSRHVLFFGMRNQIWLNQLRGECPGLAQGNVLVFGIQPATDTRLCHTDHFRNVDRYGWAPPAVMPCVLGEFQPITRAQADALRAALRNRPDRPEKPKTSAAVTEQAHE